MFGMPEGLLNGRQGFGPIGPLPMQNDPRSQMVRGGYPQLPQSHMTQPILNQARLPQSQILGGRPDQKPLFGPR